MDEYIQWPLQSFWASHNIEINNFYFFLLIKTYPYVRLISKCKNIFSPYYQTRKKQFCLSKFERKSAVMLDVIYNSLCFYQKFIESKKYHFCFSVSNRIGWYHSRLSSSSPTSKYTSYATLLHIPLGVNTYLWNVPSRQIAARKYSLYLD